MIIAKCKNFQLFERERDAGDPTRADARYEPRHTGGIVIADARSSTGNFCSQSNTRPDERWGHCQIIRSGWRTLWRCTETVPTRNFPLFLGQGMGSFSKFSFFKIAKNHIFLIFQFAFIKICFSFRFRANRARFVPWQNSTKRLLAKTTNTSERK